MRLPARPLPIRVGGPRASWDQVALWLAGGRWDLIVLELERERAHVDSLVRDGDWAR